MDRLEVAKRENANKLNEHIGEIKERLRDLEVECIGIRYIPSDYGSICIHRMLDKDGRSIIWFANSDAKMETGCKYVVAATVKKHDEFKDWKQTHVNRLKVIEEVVTT